MIINIRVDHTLADIETMEKVSKDLKELFSTLGIEDEQVFEDKPQRLCRYDVDTRTIWVYYYDSFSALNRITQDLIDTSGKGEEFEQTTTL